MQRWARTPVGAGVSLPHYPHPLPSLFPPSRVGYCGSKAEQKLRAPATALAHRPREHSTMAGEGDRCLGHKKTPLSRSARRKAAKSVTFIDQDKSRFVVGSTDDASSAMPSAASASTAMPVSVKKYAVVNRSETRSRRPAFEEAKLNLEIRTDGQGGLLCCKEAPCLFAFCGACHRRNQRHARWLATQKDSSHRPRGWSVDGDSEGQLVEHKPCLFKLQDGRCNHFMDLGRHFGWWRCENMLTHDDEQNDRPCCEPCTNGEGHLQFASL